MNEMPREELSFSSIVFYKKINSASYLPVGLETCLDMLTIPPFTDKLEFIAADEKLHASHIGRLCARCKIGIKCFNRCLLLARGRNSSKLQFQRPIRRQKYGILPPCIKHKLGKDLLETKETLDESEFMKAGKILKNLHKSLLSFWLIRCLIGPRKCGFWVFQQSVTDTIRVQI